MAGNYSGYFLKGLGQGISQGMQWGTNILNIQAQKKARDDAEKLKEKISLQSQELMGMINEYGTQYTDEEASHIRTFANASVAEVQAQFKPYLDDIETGRLKQAETKRKEISEYYDYIWTLNLTPGQVTQTLDNFKKNYTSEGALNFLKTEERMLKAKTEAREMQPAETKEPTISDYGTGLKYLTNIAKISPENWETARKGLESKFGFDYSGITQESLKETEMGDEVFNLYNTPEEVMSNVKPSAGLTVMPKRDTKTGKYYASFSKETGVGVTTPAPTSTENIREDILNADTFADAQRIYKNYADKYDETALGITDVKQEWGKGQIAYLNNVKKSIENLLVDRGDKGKWLNNSPVTKEMVGLDFDGEQPASEIYEILYKSYIEYLEKLKKLGIDISQFPELLPLSEIEKVSGTEGFFAIGGVKKGDFKSIYK